MGKIKNWDKVADTVWINTSRTGAFGQTLESRVDVSQTPPLGRGGGQWRVQIVSDYTTGVLKRTFSTKQEAMDYARDWMRDNPRGV